MRALKLILLLAGAYLLQTVVASKFAFFGVRVDILLIITTLYAVSYGPEDGFIFGLLCGLIQDVFGSGLYFNAISKSLLGFLVGTFKESVLGTEEAVAISAVSVATVTNFIFEMMIMFFFFGKPLASPVVLIATLAISCIYNSILTPVFYKAMKAVPALAAQ
jgi:rod shape-determining protein MreD